MDLKSLLPPAVVVSTNPPAKFFLRFTWDAPYTNPVVWYQWSNDVAIAGGTITNPPLVISNIVPSSFSGLSYAFLGGGALTWWKQTNYGEVRYQISSNLVTWADSPTNFWVNPEVGSFQFRVRYTNYDNFTAALQRQ